jgi:hypothetical protein
MENGGFLWDTLSVKKGNRVFLCYLLQELDEKIEGAFIESNRVFKARNP